MQRSRLPAYLISIGEILGPVDSFSFLFFTLIHSLCLSFGVNRIEKRLSGLIELGLKSVLIFGVPAGEKVRNATSSKS